MDVVYAHTDSLYVPIPSIEVAQDVQKILNKHIQEVVFPNIMNLESHPMDLEFEKYYSVLGVGATRNRNAGYINWKDGVYLAEPEFFATGFSVKRIAESKLAKEVQKKTLEMWINQKTEQEIVTFVKKKYNDVLKGRIDKLNLVKRSRVKENRMTLKCRCRKKYNVDYVRKLLSVLPESLCEKDNCNSKLISCTTVEDKRPSFGGGFAGMLYYNEHINPQQKLDDSFYHIKCKFGINQKQTFTNWNGKENKAGYIAVRNLEELEPFEPDWPFLAEAEVLKKVKPIFEAMEWDISQIKIDESQTSLGDWF